MRHKFELIFLVVSAKNKALFFLKSLQEQNITSPLTGVSNAYRSYGSYGSSLGILEFFADVYQLILLGRNGHRDSSTPYCSYQTVPKMLSCSGVCTFPITSRYLVCVTLTQVRWHHPRLPPSGNNLGTALCGYLLHVRLFAIRRAPSGAGAKPTSPA